MGLLDGRVVIVTGGGRGLGRSHCLELAAAGATVVVNDLGVSLRGESEPGDRSPAERVVAEIEAQGGQAVTNADSVTDWQAMESLIADTVARFGDVHAVVNNAGFLRDRMITSLTEEDFDAVVAVHLKGAFVLTRHACSYWRERAKAGHEVSGRIVNTTSGSGLFGNIGQANYAPAKAGIASLTQVTAMEMVRYGVTANAISPIAATRMLGADEATASETWSPLDAANAAPLVAWLCSAGSGWLSGQVLRVEGGDVRRVRGWSIGDAYSSRGGEALSIDELDVGMRQLFDAHPHGIPMTAPPEGQR